jgi:hypothetical protein
LPSRVKWERDAAKKLYLQHSEIGNAVNEETKLRPIVVLPENTPAKLVKEFLDSGYLPVCTDCPSKVILIRDAQTRWTGDDLTMAALSALLGDGAFGERTIFVRALFKRLQKDEPKPKEFQIPPPESKG